MKRGNMDENELNEILKKIESELNGDPEHDIEIWFEWGERYRGKPGAESLMEEIGERMIPLIIESEGDMPVQIYNDMMETADEDYEEACGLIRAGKYEEALPKLLVLTSLIKSCPLDSDYIWADFNSFLDSLVFQDYYSDMIGDREVLRHPMHPGRILYTCGSLLIEMNRAEEALEPLELLSDLDPVCPKYLFELGEAYKRTGQIKEAHDTAMWALACASTREELARGYRDLAWCMSESGAYEDSVMLYLLSLRRQSSRLAEAEVTWIRKKTGISPEDYDEDRIFERCRELKIPLEISETVRNNMELLDFLMGDDQEPQDN